MNANKNTSGNLPDHALSNLLKLVCQFPGTVVFTTDADGNYTFLGGPGLEYLGIKQEEWIGRSMFEFLGDSPEHQAMMRRVFQGETLFDDSCFGGHYYEDRFCPIYDSEGTLTGVAGIQFNVTPRVLAEKALKESVDLLDNLFDSIPDNAYILDLDFKILRVNKAARTMFPHLDASGMKCYESIHGLDGPCKFCPVVETFQTGQPAIREYFEEKIGGYFELISFPLRDQHTGEIIGATEFARDITDRKLMEDSLLRSQALLDELMENLIEGVYLIDTEYTIIRANKTMKEMYPELTPLVGRKCYETTVYDRVCPDCAAERMFCEGKPTRRTFYEKNPGDGTGKWLELEVFPLYGPKGGRINGAICVLHDVTPRIEMESQLDDYRIQIQRMAEKQMEELRINEAKLRTILETCGAAISFADYQGRLTYVNGMFKNLYGYSEEELLGKHMTDLMDSDPENIAKETELIESLLQGKSERYRTTRELKTGNGRKVWGDIHVNMIYGSTPEETQLISVILDITAQREMVDHLNRAKTAAEEASQAKSQFLATMSHEIRTPLNGVIGISNLLMDTPLQPKQREYARLVKASGESLLFLINDILDFSKIEAGKFELEQSEFIVQDLVESVLGIMASNANEKNLELVATFDELVPGPVLGDPGRLRQVLVNLVGNAMKFSEKGGVRIHVTVEKLLMAENQIELMFSVTDTGIGIAEDRLERLFHRFSQVDASSARLYGGTGLGLAISKKLVELMGGDIHVRSVQGKGSTFWFTARFECETLLLECLEECRDTKEYSCIVENRDFCYGNPPERCARSGREVAYLQRTAELRGMKTLLVGTGDVAIPALIEQMQVWDLDVLNVPNAQTAMRTLDEQGEKPFQLAIIDFAPGDVDAERLVQFIQGNKRYRDMPIIGLVSLSDDLRRKPWKDPEKIRFISKPICCSILLDSMVRSFFTLPALSLQPGSGVLESTAVKTGAARILVAEDNSVNRIVISEILKNADMECVVVDNGEKAVQAVMESPFDVVLMDCQMPLMDGYEATRIIRRRELEKSARPLPIIALTANATSEDEAKCLAAGMDAYCSKPIEVAKLLDLIQREMEKK